ncbi:MAG: hypothetical protein JSW47_01225 [Phycisphaerales bacterium]|nr:MAG: hypothetical protein JSW47_01225 [Phycisphaerales bacterium]
MLPKGNILLVGAFALPVLCCLIGAGAFVLLVTPPAAGVQGPNPNEVKTLQQKVNELRAELKRVDEVLMGLKEEQTRVALEQKVKELLDKLESSTAELLREVTGLSQEVIIIEGVIQDLGSSDGERQKRRDPQKAVGRLQASALQSCLNPTAHTDMPPQDRNERG